MVRILRATRLSLVVRTSVVMKGSLMALEGMKVWPLRVRASAGSLA